MVHKLYYYEERNKAPIDAKIRIVILSKLGTKKQSLLE